MKKTLKKIGLIVLIVALSVILTIGGLFGGIIGGVNVAKFAIYRKYYSAESRVRTNPGLNDGFVCQSLAYVDGTNKILVGGRMAKDEQARIYVTDENNHSYYVNITQDGKPLISHAGGLACHGDNVYIAAEDNLYRLSLQDVLSAEKGGSAEVLEIIPVNNQASFVYIDDTTNSLYVGEFNHYGTKYLTNHPYGENDAIVEKYSLADLTTPVAIYSIPDKVQGFCAANGKFVMSTSWSIGDSHYYVYDEADMKVIEGAVFKDRNGVQLDVPVYELGECKLDLKGPAMAEGLDYMDGKVITLSESASNKYIFGKFFFAFDIVALDILN